jgi:hypothetical protein
MIETILTVVFEVFALPFESIGLSMEIAMFDVRIIAIGCAVIVGTALLAIFFPYPYLPALAKSSGAVLVAASKVAWHPPLSAKVIEQQTKHRKSH